MSRMNTAFAVVSALFLTVTPVACSGGDGSTEDRSAELTSGSCVLPAGPLAVAISRRANSPGDLPPQVSQIVESFINDIPAGVTGPTLSLVNIDGRSEVHDAGQFFSDSRNSQGLEDDQRQFLAGFLSTAAGMRAAESEVDVLAALEEAGSAAGRPGAGTVVLVDSGLATSGALDFSQPGVLDAPAEDLVPFLQTTGALPDLRGLTVVLVGIGEVARPQQKLSTRKKQLIELWTKIAEASGAACVTSVDVARPDDPVDGEVKPVKLVPVPPPPVFVPDEITILPDAGEVGFEPGKAVFRDREAARRALEPIASQLRADPSYRLRLTGTTARWGTRDYQIDLATQRAEAVKNELLELVGLGADPKRMETRGLGSYFAQYIPDNGPDGVLLPGPAQANRTVRIEPCNPTCPADSEAPPA